MFIAKVFSFFFVCILAACGNSVSQTENVNRTQPKEKTELSLKMERSGCYGMCPIYDLTVKTNGKVGFEGKFYTEIKGKAEDKLSEEQMEQLSAEIEKSNFFSLDNAYDHDSKNCPELATDLPSVNLAITLNGKKKTINHYYGCFEKETAKQSKDWTEKVFPQELYNLENKIDEIVETKCWIGEGK